MNLETVGKVMIAFGAILSLYAFNMPVTVGDSGIVNIHLISERQNTLLFGGFFFLAGIILFAVFKLKQAKEGSGSDGQYNTQDRGGMRKCPSCAEMVRAEAIRCRFCQLELTPITPTAPDRTSSTPSNLQTNSSLEDEAVAHQKIETENLRLQAENERKAAYSRQIQAALKDPSGRLINAFGIDGKTPIMQAIHLRDTDAIQALISAGARTDQMWNDASGRRYVSVEELARESGPEIFALFR